METGSHHRNFSLKTLEIWSYYFYSKSSKDNGDKKFKIIWSLRIYYSKSRRSVKCIKKNVWKEFMYVDYEWSPGLGT